MKNASVDLRRVFARYPDMSLEDVINLSFYEASHVY